MSRAGALALASVVLVAFLLALGWSVWPWGPVESASDGGACPSELVVAGTHPTLGEPARVLEVVIQHGDVLRVPLQDDLASPLVVGLDVIGAVIAPADADGAPLGDPDARGTYVDAHAQCHLWSAAEGAPADLGTFVVKGDGIVWISYWTGG